MQGHAIAKNCSLCLPITGQCLKIATALFSDEKWQKSYGEQSSADFTGIRHLYRWHEMLMAQNYLSIKTRQGGKTDGIVW